MFQHRQIGAVGQARHPDRSGTERREHTEHQEPAGIVHQHHIPRPQELASDIGGNNGRNGADLGKLAASLMLPADGARVMMEFTDRPAKGFAVSDAVRMRLRVKAMDRRRGFRTYFWKAVPTDRPTLEIK